MNEHLIASLAQFGMAGVIFGGMMLGLKWVVQSNEKRLEAYEASNIEHQKILKGFAENVKENTVSAKEFQAQVRLDHTASAKEHGEMIATLARINGHK